MKSKTSTKTGLTNLNKCLQLPNFKTELTKQLESWEYYKTLFFTKNIQILEDSIYLRILYTYAKYSYRIECLLAIKRDATV